MKRWTRLSRPLSECRLSLVACSVCLSPGRGADPERRDGHPGLARRPGGRRHVGADAPRRERRRHERRQPRPEPRHGARPAARGAGRRRDRRARSPRARARAARWPPRAGRSTRRPGRPCACCARMAPTRPSSCRPDRCAAGPWAWSRGNSNATAWRRSRWSCCTPRYARSRRRAPCGCPSSTATRSGPPTIRRPSARSSAAALDLLQDEQGSPCRSSGSIRPGRGDAGESRAVFAVAGARTAVCAPSSPRLSSPSWWDRQQTLRAPPRRGALLAARTRIGVRPSLPCSAASRSPAPPRPPRADKRERRLRAGRHPARRRPLSAASPSVGPRRLAAPLAASRRRRRRPPPRRWTPSLRPSTVASRRAAPTSPPIPRAGTPTSGSRRR